MQVIPVPGCEFFADQPDLFKILVFHLCDFTISSRGEQITGISKPTFRQVAASAPPKAAFAKCRQFQVKGATLHSKILLKTRRGRRGRRPSLNKTLRIVSFQEGQRPR